MATELAKAYVQIIPSAEGIKGKITEALGGEASSAGDSAGKTAGNKLVAGIKGIIAAAGIGAALKSAISEGAALEQSIGGIETLFKESSNAVIENAKIAYKTAGLSANEYMETVTSFSASLLQGLGGDTQKAADVADMAITDMSDNANKMGSSMELIQNAYNGFAKQNYTMLDNLKLGYGGTKSEMERLLADAQKISGVEYNIDNLSDVYEAIHVIQEELDITGTTAKEAATTLSGSMASMVAAAKNVMGNLALGENIGPSLKELRNTVSVFLLDNLIPMVGNILSNIPTLLNGATSILFEMLRHMINGGIKNIIQAALDVTVQLISELAGDISALVNFGWDILQQLVQGIIEAATNTDWNEIADNIVSNFKSGIGDSEFTLEAAQELISNFLATITDNLPAVLQMGIEFAGNLADGILENLPYAIESIGYILQKLLNFITDNLPVIMQAGIEIVKKLAEGLAANGPEIASSAVQIVVQLLGSIAEKLPEFLEMGITLLGELTAGLIKAIPDLLAAIPGIISDICDSFTDFDWADIGKNIIDGIKNGIKNAASSIADAAKDAAKSALNGVKGLLGIHSPSRVFENEVGKMIDLGLAAGIEGNVSQVTDAMKELSDSTVGMIDTDFSVSPVMSVADTTKSVMNTEINFNGTYSFNDKSDINYFMNQAALRLAVSR